MKCDLCDKSATVHLIEIQGGQKIEKHLCEDHAAQEGVAVKTTQAPINELLEKFVLKHSETDTSKVADLVCECCGLSYEEFRKGGLLGCPDCYEAFGHPLQVLIERAHENADRHLGKVPRHAGVNEARQQTLLRLRSELEDAVASEQYELAASLHKKLDEAESGEE
ncbi:MAG: UvrB/UvrC motif-containing protein [Planctomycetota bacterium]|jgi:protein arginine kinase activator